MHKAKVKQKSLTESGLEGALGHLSKTLRVRLFIETQGFLLNASIVLQDNQYEMNKTRRHLQRVLK